VSVWAKQSLDIAEFIRFCLSRSHIPRSAWRALVAPVMPIRVFVAVNGSSPTKKSCRFGAATSTGQFQGERAFCFADAMI
jgi:hypothetical protein